MARQIADISVRMVDGEPMLDLAYTEDVAAEVDLNVVITAAVQLVEVQGTAEKAPVDRADFDDLLDLSAHGIRQLVVLQNKALHPS